MQDRHRLELEAAQKTLTPRERDVMNALLLGQANKVIAMELGMSMRTVETHRSRIFLKMGVRNAIELVRRFYAPELWALGLAMWPSHPPKPGPDAAPPGATPNP